MGSKNWEEFLWKELRTIPVKDLNANRFKLLDVFAQDGSTFTGRVLPMVRIGSMISLGDEEDEEWVEKRDELEAGRSFDTESDVGEGFEEKNERNRTYSGAAKSNFLISVLQSVNAKLDFSGEVEVELRDPFYRKFDEDTLVGLITGAVWKPNVKMIAKVERKGRHRFQRERDLELWIVTELKYVSSFAFKSSRSRDANANVNLPQVATVFPAAGNAQASTSITNRAESAPATAEETSGTYDHTLIGFKAVRVKFDLEGNYISRKGHMGGSRPKVRAGEEEFNPDADPEEHMGDFFVSDAGEGDSFVCRPQLFMEDEDSDE